MNGHPLSLKPFRAFIFDLDGVVTDTAKVHAAAWKELFDDFLKQRARRGGEEFRAFDADADYRRYVDGKPRYDGIQSFLNARGIELPYGDPEDGPDKETVCGLANRKNELFRERLKQDGVDVFESTVALIRQLKSIGIKTAIISASKNCRPILKQTRLTDLFDAVVDGVDSARLKLKGKPDPAIFVEAARQLSVRPEQAVVVEDALAGVRAGKDGGFGCVIGVDRTGHADELREHGADIVVADLSELKMDEDNQQAGVDARELPSAMNEVENLVSNGGRQLALFLDYDGTLTPIVSRPEDAVLPEATREVLKRLAELATVAIISGRDLPDVRERAGLENIVYAGSHGFDIAGPEGLKIENQRGKEFLPTLDAVEAKLKKRLASIDGAQVERKKFSVAIHYRNVKEQEANRVEEAVDEMLREHGDLRKGRGKKVFELQPDIEWDKGKAVLWLMEQLGLEPERTLPIYIGDDITDEDAFRALRDIGIGIVVRDEARETAARFALEDADDVRRFLERLAKALERAVPRKA